MIKIVCDKCGKEITLRYFEQGLESLPGWDLVPHFNPLNKEYYYRTFCQECNPKVVRKKSE